MDVGGRGIRQWARQRKKDYLEGDGEEVVISKAMKWNRRAVTNYCRLRGGRDTGPYNVQLSNDQKGEGRGRMGQKRVGDRGGDEMGQLGCITVKEVSEDREHWECR